MLRLIATSLALAVLVTAAAPSALAECGDDHCVYLPVVIKSPGTTVVVFCDHNGNGVQDTGEAGIPGVALTVLEASCESDQDGLCYFGTPFTGDFLVSVNADPVYRYISPDSSTEIPISNGIHLQLNPAAKSVLPLIEGPYRSPFRNLAELRVGNWVDLDKRSCLGPFPDRECEYIRDWLGGRNSYDGHQGFDVEFGLGTDVDIYPMRAGTVFMLREGAGTEGYEIMIRDSVPYGTGGYSYQSFIHFAEAYVVEGQHVNPSTRLGGGGVVGGGAIHVGHYVDVPPGQHPLDGDFRIPPHADRVRSPFAERLWTSFDTFGKVIEIQDGGSERQIYP